MFELHVPIWGTDSLVGTFEKYADAVTTMDEGKDRVYEIVEVVVLDLDPWVGRFSRTVWPKE